MRFDGKVGVVTGGGSGIGRATAIGFAQRGGSVVIAEFNEEAANKVAAEITAVGGKAVACRTDVSKAADIQAAIDLARSRFGQAGLPAQQCVRDAASMAAVAGGRNPR